MTTFSAKDDLTGGNTVIVKVRLSWFFQDQHAHTEQVPDVALDVQEMDSPNASTNATLTLENARKLGNALLALADEADQYNTFPTPGGQKNDPK